MCRSPTRETGGETKSSRRFLQLSDYSEYELSDYTSRRTQCQKRAHSLSYTPCLGLPQVFVGPTFCTPSTINPMIRQIYDTQLDDAAPRRLELTDDQSPNLLLTFDMVFSGAKKTAEFDSNLASSSLLHCVSPYDATFAIMGAYAYSVDRIKRESFVFSQGTKPVKWTPGTLCIDKRENRVVEAGSGRQGLDVPTVDFNLILDPIRGIASRCI
ncbi:hypothetical protein GQ44DRAFT_725180 [Phaeosphaeriaceae sp. PMI808]|nr:hypothetical protein GQ44DRAFT_725180 [Phaeosphaeriaceae sp. PMI808]